MTSPSPADPAEPVTLVAISVGFGSPRAIAVLAVLGYRVVSYWLQSGTRTGADLTAAIALANASKGEIAFPVAAIRSGLRGDDREVRRWPV
jgi:hypothetical protein